MMTTIPQSVSEVVNVLAAMPGTVAVVLRGSRALDCHDEGSDRDLGVYDRGAMDLSAVATRGAPLDRIDTRPCRTDALWVAFCYKRKGGL